MAKFLLDNGADPNLNLQRGESILMAAARTNKPDLTRLLIQYGATVKTLVLAVFQTFIHFFLNFKHRLYSGYVLSMMRCVKNSVANINHEIR